MITTIDKALAAFAITFLVTLNQKYGFHFDTSAQTASVFQSLIDSAINGVVGGLTVWFFPNKAS